MGDTIPVGYRFHPTDEELVGHYLKYKLLGDDYRVHNVIAEIDVCKFEPWDLPAFSKVKSEDPEWFFFSPLELKYKNSTTRYNRTTNAGFWKPTGKDRKIKARGSNNVIGTKKTLVFYKNKAQPSRAVKTNWVIHEYHAHPATVPLPKGTFVVCRLIEKAEKKGEGRTDNVSVNEGEPVVADHEYRTRVDRTPYMHGLPDINLESVFLAPPQAYESDFSSIQFSPVVTEQEPNFQDSSFANACFGIENNTRQFPFDSTEEEDNIDSFIESILVDDDDFIREERRHSFDSFVNESTSALPFRTFGNFMDITAVNEHVVSSGSQIMKIETTSQDATYTKTEASREQKDSTSGDNFWGADTSDDSMANPSYSICFIERVRSPSPPMAIPLTSGRVKTRYHPRYNDSVSQITASRRSQAQRKLSSKAESQHEVPKETQRAESMKDKKKAHDSTRSRKNLETASKGCFIYKETPSMAQNRNPRSVYLVNVVVGISLLIVTICDMVSFGKRSPLF